MAFTPPKPAYTGKQKPAPTSTPPAKPASPNIAKAESHANLKTTFGTPRKQR